MQNYADDARPIKDEESYVGEMSNQIAVFAEGKWLRFARSYLGDLVRPGTEVELRVVSSAPPGLVGCRVTAGELTLKGVGEHMPTELENVMPGYEEWPKGSTIGPVSALTSLSQKQRADYLLDRLPEFEQAGWMTAAARRWYEKRLKQGDLGAVLRQAEDDLKSEQLTTEVVALLQAAAEKR